MKSFVWRDWILLFLIFWAVILCNYTLLRNSVLACCRLNFRSLLVQYFVLMKSSRHLLPQASHCLLKRRKMEGYLGCKAILVLLVIQRLTLSSFLPKMVILQIR